MILPWKKKKTVKILSIDGGGIRGYIPALVLEKLSAIMKNNNINASFNGNFDIIAGTSSGALTALGMTVPCKNKDSSANIARYSMSEIVNIYETCRTDIFPEKIIEKIAVLEQAFHGKYNSSGLEKLLDSMFGNYTMGDCLGSVLISGFDILSNKPVIIGNNDNFYMKDVARGSSAAPTFFEPAMVESISKDKQYCMVDGAMAANNPAMFAYTEAMQKFPKAEKIVILSLGTGYSRDHYSYEQVKNWGFVEWILPTNGTPIYSIMSSAQEGCVGIQLRQLPNVDYYRINPVLSRESLEIDNISFENMRVLKSAAGKVIEENKDLLLKLARDLTSW